LRRQKEVSSKRAKRDNVLPVVERSFWYEVRLVMLLCFALLLIVAPLLVLLETQEILQVETLRNLGVVGAEVGHFLVRWAGVASLGCGLGVFVGLMRCWDLPVGLSWYQGVRAGVRILLLTAVCATLGWLLKGSIGGGVFGSLVGRALVGLIGQVGTFISAVVVLIALIPQEAFLTIGRIFYRFGFLSVELAQFIFDSTLTVWKAFKNGIARVRMPVSAVAAVENLPVRKVSLDSRPKGLAETKEDKRVVCIKPPVVVVQERSAKQQLRSEFVARDSEYNPPRTEFLVESDTSSGDLTQEDYDALSATITKKLQDFQIEGSVTRVHPGPVITLFEFEPVPGVKVGRIASLADDLAMSLKASSIRILAPIPGQGTVGIEVPNRHRQTVRLRDILESDEFQSDSSPLVVPLGKDTHGVPVVADIARMPHLLIAGATGTGKSVCINSLLLGLLFRASPSEVGLILIDPKILELSIYADIPHLRVPVVTVAKQARAVLQWAVGEMERRYRLMQRFSVRSIDAYNQAIKAGARPSRDTENEEFCPLQKIVIVIDELADLMLQVGRDIEELITRLAQKARASGIHLIVATQRPSVDVITGLIKANFPARLSFRVASRVDSRTILDQIGAERLLGKGDMLFMAPGTHTVCRIHGAFVSDEEVSAVIQHIKAYAGPQYDPDILAACEKALEEEASGSGSLIEVDEYDALYDKAVQLVLSKGTASTSMIQRFFRIGYNRAARLIELMEREGIVGPMDGARPRDVLVATDEIDT
jgi:S-DNA-T family DNA segregation ATPase FtsK/SpoIIIE